MNKRIKVSVMIVGLTTIASLAACVPDPYSQKDGHTTNTQVPQPYPEVYVPPGQPGYAAPQYVQSTQVPTTQVRPIYDPISQSERVSISRGTCDPNLLATPDAAANQFAGAATGPLVAGYAQSTMTPVDNSCVSLTLEFAQDNQPVAWQNPSNGVQYQVVPIRAYQQSNGPICREYTTVSMVNGQSVSARDIACRLPNGAWQLQS